MNQNKVALTLADTEYSYQIPQFAKEFTFKLRPLNDGAKLKYYFVAGGDVANSIYTTLESGQSRSFNGALQTVLIYFKSNVAGQTVEVDYWI